MNEYNSDGRQAREAYQSPRAEISMLEGQADVLASSNEHWGEEALWV
ncbi:MAG: hypothetical protein IJ654_00090 [Bacteroidales bacterium]|nr:hypothetical protein [Bacteroidales bacterium]